jgi:RsiW-degrading membrane proteinase PrsW (M82 family)
MTGQPPRSAFLRRISPANATAQSSALHPLMAFIEVAIGRDPNCQVIFDSSTYGGISRQHAKVCRSPESPSGWQVCDLGSANGTFVNGQQIQGCRALQAGDRISLGRGEPQLVFELQSVWSSPPIELPVPPASPAQMPTPSTIPGAFSHPPASSSDAVTLSQLFPIVSTGKDLTRKAYLIPGVLTVCFVVLMFVSVGNFALFNLLLAAYLAGAAYYFIYQLCGKRKPWWLLISTAIFTALLLLSPLLLIFAFIFRGILPGVIPEGDIQIGFLPLLFHMFFGAGLMEELLKAVPVLLLCLIGTKLRSPYRERLGIWEPLDGILLGAASAVGFTLLETLGQYVPEVVNQVNLQAGEGMGQGVGLQLLIARILGSVSGHLAYSGYFGYFIGLSMLKPSRRWRILVIGYLSASALHALWNATGSINFLVLALVGVLSYAFLAAAILKARALSPMRSQNFATRLTRLP